MVSVIMSQVQPDFTVIEWHCGDTDFFQRSSFIADCHNGPDGDLQTAGRGHAHAQRFTPQWIHIGPVVERRSVHLNEDVGQDKLQPQGERHRVSGGMCHQNNNKKPQWWQKGEWEGQQRNATGGTQIECQFLLLNYSQLLFWRFQHSWLHFKVAVLF